MPPTSDGNIRTVGCSVSKLVPDAEHLGIIREAGSSGSVRCATIITPRQRTRVGREDVLERRRGMFDRLLKGPNKRSDKKLVRDTFCCGQKKNTRRALEQCQNHPT